MTCFDELNIPTTGGMYVTKYIQPLDVDNLSDLDGVTYDALVDWMNVGMWKYFDSLQTTVVDLTAFREAGGKLLHYYGESNPSIPAASFAHYWQVVREAIYKDLSDVEAQQALQEWDQFYLVPGAAHCSSNSLQPVPFPQNNMDIMIDWVKNGKQLDHLDATVSSGDNAGETQMLCQWPNRPIWSGNSTNFECESDRGSIDNWTYEFNASKIPVW